MLTVQNGSPAVVPVREDRPPANATSVSVGNLSDDAAERALAAAEPAEVVGHLPGADVLGRGAEQGRDQGAQLTVGESVG